MKTATLATAVLALVLITGSTTGAADLPAADAGIIEGAGVPLYTDALFVNGSQDVGFRFATAKTPEDVRSWYREQLAAWSLYEEYGGWILYEGAPGAGMGELMSRKQVAVKKNESMNAWFGVDNSLSTEIVIMIPRQ